RSGRDPRERAPRVPLRAGLGHLPRRGGPPDRLRAQRALGRGAGGRGRREGRPRRGARRRRRGGRRDPRGPAAGGLRMWIVLEAVCAGARVEAPDAPLLRDVSLSVARGEYVAVLGPSGAGKSLLLEVIAGLRCPSSGRYWLDGRRVDRLSD